MALVPRRFCLTPLASTLDYDLFVTDSLVDLYCKCGDIDSTVMAFRVSPYRNIVYWISLLSRFVHNGKHAEALALFSFIVDIVEVTLANLLATCKVSGNLHQRTSIHARVIHGYSQSNNLAVNSLFDAYFTCHAETTLAFVEENNISNLAKTLPGDIGQWQPGGSLKIVDRNKNIFQHSQVEYVAMDNFEDVYGLVSDIVSIWVYRNSFEVFLVVINPPKHAVEQRAAQTFFVANINPNTQEVEQWATQISVTGDFNALCEIANEKLKNPACG
ncbi:Long chain acyl-CoA synthetase 4 [Striga hermonthica]|uniref:Long chain acyl-CoA synthetase 4 n=1 Tax=Striga hermonthica TaxID=68872 RepID=A0A9N7N6A1_STRHE|nr:Long chain acyl-CoA synthetase 4 [Striga hermonthica]